MQKANAQLKNQKKDYDLIALAEELKKRNLIGASLHVDCAPGEIAIHPSDTAETFHKVKGVNAYNKVCENLHKYRESSGQIILKYILLDENCNSQDAEGFIELCKTLKIAKIDISAGF